MRTSSVGKANSGVTLIEMMVVVAIVAALAGLSFPAVSAGLDSVRLASASDSIAGLFNTAMNRADRRGEIVEIAVAPRENVIWLHSSQPGFEQKLEMPAGVRILGEPVLYMLMPGDPPPAIGIEIRNEKGSRRLVRVDPVTGAPRIERLDRR